MRFTLSKEQLHKQLLNYEKGSESYFDYEKVKTWIKTNYCLNWKDYSDCIREVSDYFEV